MAESETKRPRRTPQERAAAVDEKIAKFNQSIAELEEKKTAALAEYDAKITALQEREIVQQAVKSGMSVEDVASKLQVEIAE